MFKSRMKIKQTSMAFILVLMLLSVLFPFSISSGQPGGTWTAKAPMPTKRFGVAAVALDGKIYAISGDSAIGSIHNPFVDRYDQAADTWTTVASIPNPRHGLSAVVLDGRIFAIGGQFCGGGLPCFSDGVDVYDPVSDSWSSRAPLPTPRTGMGAVVLGGKIYTIGGYQEWHSPTETMNIVEIYDPATDTWALGTPMQVTRCAFSCVVLGGKIYAFSGHDGTGGATSTCEVYDPVTDQWSYVTPMPVSRAWYACDTLGGKACIVGGRGVEGQLDDSAFWVYDPAADMWESAEPMLTARHSCAGVSVNGRLYVLGGNTDVQVGTIFDKVEAYTANWLFDFTSLNWEGEEWCGNVHVGSWFPQVSGSEGDFATDDYCWGELRTLDTLPTNAEITFEVFPKLHSGGINFDVALFGIAETWLGHDQTGFVRMEMYNDSVFLDTARQNQFQTHVFIGTYTSDTWIPVRVRVIGGERIQVSGPAFSGTLANTTMAGPVRFVAANKDSQDGFLMRNVTISPLDNLTYFAGSGHWYEVMSCPIPGVPCITWTQARDSASTLGGYLACVQDAAENSYLASLYPIGHHSMPIGGYELSEGNWAWLSGEPFSYTNWNAGEPNNIGNAQYTWFNWVPIGTWDDGTDSPGQCFVVEYGPQIINQTTDSLIMPSTITESCEGCPLPVSVKLVQPIKAATIPIEIPEGLVVCSLSFAGLETQDWEYNYRQVKPDSGFMLIVLANSHGERLPIGTTPVCNIFFEMSVPCGQSAATTWDTALSYDSGRQLKFTDTLNHSLHPGFVTAVSTVSAVPGDLFPDLTVDISDLQAMIDYLFFGGPICSKAVANLNHDTAVDISDLQVLIDYLFQGGVAPACHGTGLTKKLVTHGEIAVTSEYDGVSTVVRFVSAEQVCAFYLELTGSGADQAVNLGDPSLETLAGRVGDVLRVGLLDLNGGVRIPAGNRAVLRLEGEYQIVRALVCDENHQTIQATIGAAGKESTLPTSFALSQNYPNPFNPNTQISFDLTVAARANLSIYNLLGQQVRVLVDGTLEAGSHLIEWDGRGSDGQPVASGVYLYRLNAGNFVETRKMMLLK